MPRLENTTYKIDRRLERDLGREGARVQEWIDLTFVEFIDREEFTTVESVVAYFLDHDESIGDALNSLVAEGRFLQFLEKYFGSVDKRINRHDLATEIGKAVQILQVDREEIVANASRRNKQCEEVISSYSEYHPQFEDERLLVIPSLEVYDYIVTGAISRNLRKGGMGSLGSTSYPKSDSSDIIKRVAFVPMAYTIESTAQENNIRLSVTSISAFGGKVPWFDNALRTALHEQEHARVYGKKSGEYFVVGFKKLPVKGNNSYADASLERDRDEGMTEFITIWKELILEGTLDKDTSAAEVLAKVREQAGTSPYAFQVYKVVGDIEHYQNQFKNLNAIKVFLSSYINSSAYPIYY